MNEHWKSELIRLIQECRSENSDQRFGQFLYNLIGSNDMFESGTMEANYDTVFHQRFFNIEDAELVQMIKDL